MVVSALEKILATVDRDGLAGHEIAQRRAEKEHRADEILGLLHALERAPLHGRLAHAENLFGRVVFGQRRAGSDAVDLDVVAADLARERAGEADDARLGRHIMNTPE